MFIKMPLIVEFWILDQKKDCQKGIVDQLLARNSRERKRERERERERESGWLEIQADPQNRCFNELLAKNN